MICEKHKCEKLKYVGYVYGFQDIFYICPKCRQETIDDPNSYKGYEVLHDTENSVIVKISKIDEIIAKLESTYGDMDKDEIKIRDAILMLENLKKVG